MIIKQKYTAGNVKVTPIDMNKLNTIVDDYFKTKQKLPDIKYQIHGTLAIINQPLHCIIDDEFVGHDIKDLIIFNVWESNGTTNNCMPTFTITLSLDELKEYLQPEITLAEFTKERRGYNSRIRANEAEWMRAFNK